VLRPVAVAATLPPPAVVTPEVTVAPPTPEVTLCRHGRPGTTPPPLSAQPADGRGSADPDDSTAPIAVKLSNAPPTGSRPQAGLNDADLIFGLTEGSVTRFTAIFYDTVAPNGPVRAHVSLIWSCMGDHAGLLWASVGVNQRLNASDFSDRFCALLTGLLPHWRHNQAL
jgi:hypothetical protein